MKDVIAYLILFPFFFLIGKVIWRFYYRLGVGLCRMFRPATRAGKSTGTAGNGGWDHAGELLVRSGSHRRSGDHP